MTARVIPFPEKREPCGRSLEDAHLSVYLKTRYYRRLVSVAGVTGLTVTDLLERIVCRGLDGE